MQSAQKKRILYIDSSDWHIGQIKEILFKHGMIVTGVKDLSHSMNTVYNDPPDLIMLRYGADTDAVEISYMLKSDNFFGHLPILMVFPEKEMPNPMIINDMSIDDFVVAPYRERELLLRIFLCLRRGITELDANPLTRLPGNHTITRVIQRALDMERTFGLVYLDMHHFKPFNDRYGFSRGDEVLRMTARILVNTVMEFDPEGSFIGHIGGDDFVFMLKVDKLRECAEQLMTNFDMLAPVFYDDQDRINGFYISRDRQGIKREFELLTLNMAGVICRPGKFNSYSEVVSASAKVMKYIKCLPGSSFSSDEEDVALTLKMESNIDQSTHG